MTASRIEATAAPTNFSVSVDFTFKGVAIGGVGTVLPVYWNTGFAFVSWPVSFASVSGTGTSGVFVANCPSLAFLPSQDAGWAVCNGVMTPLKYLNTGVIQGTLTLIQGYTLTLFAFLTQQPLTTL